MAIFNVAVGVGVGVIALLPLFFVESKLAKRICFIIAICLAGLGFWVSSISIYPRYLNWQFESQLQQQPIFQVIAQYHPKEYQAFLNKIESDGALDKASRGAVYSAELVNTIFYQHLEKAPDDYIELYLKSTIALYQYLNGLSPITILKLENIQVDDPDLLKVWEDKQFRTLLGHLLDTKRYIIEASVRTPQAPPTEQQAGPIIDKIIQDLNQQFTPEVVKAVFSKNGQSIPTHVAASLLIQFYNLILASGKENAGIAIRYMAYLKNKNSVQNK